MSPRVFLQTAGALLMVLAVLGFLRPDLAGGFWSFDPGENWTHLLAGIALLLAAPLELGAFMRWIAAGVGAALLALGAYGFLVAGNLEPNAFGLVNFESPVDNVVHLLFGAWGVLAALLNRRREIL